MAFFGAQAGSAGPGSLTAGGHRLLGWHRACGCFNTCAWLHSCAVSQLKDVSYVIVAQLPGGQC